MVTGSTFKSWILKNQAHPHTNPGEQKRDLVSKGAKYHATDDSTEASSGPWVMFVSGRYKIKCNWHLLNFLSSSQIQKGLTLNLILEWIKTYFMKQR